MLPKNSLDKLKDYVQYKQQVEDSMTIIGNVKDRERCKNICACLPTVMQDFDRFLIFQIPENLPNQTPSHVLSYSCSGGHCSLSLH